MKKLHKKLTLSFIYEKLTFPTFYDILHWIFKKTIYVNYIVNLSDISYLDSIDIIVYLYS